MVLYTRAVTGDILLSGDVRPYRLGCGPVDRGDGHPSGAPGKVCSGLPRRPSGTSLPAKGFGTDEGGFVTEVERSAPTLRGPDLLPPKMLSVEKYPLLRTVGRAVRGGSDGLHWKSEVVETGSRSS